MDQFIIFFKMGFGSHLKTIRWWFWGSDDQMIRSSDHYFFQNGFWFAPQNHKMVVLRFLYQIIRSSDHYFF